MDRVGFVGIGHTGHTLIASGLHCHPNVVMLNHYGAWLENDDVLDKATTDNVWVGSVYSFEHAAHSEVKANIQLVGTTQLNEPADYEICMIKNPRTVTYSLKEKYKTNEMVLARLEESFELIDRSNGFKLYYEDVVASPTTAFRSLGLYLGLSVTDKWLSDCCSLIKPVVNRPFMVPCDDLIKRYDWLRRYV